jgi:YbgC/YbaW family acyl-CoA thioester hydrolase
MSRPTLARDELLSASPGPLRHAARIRFQDVDAAGVIFFARAFDLFSDAFFAALEHHGYAGSRMLEERRVVTPVKHAEAHFVAPLRFADRVEVVIVLAVVRESDFTLGYRVERVASSEPAVVGSVHQVSVDAGSFRRCGLPDELRAAVAAMAGDA